MYSMCYIYQSFDMLPYRLENEEIHKDELEHAKCVELHVKFNEGRELPVLDLHATLDLADVHLPHLLKLILAPAQWYQRAQKW